jgi:hypothetical protein
VRRGPRRPGARLCSGLLGCYESAGTADATAHPMMRDGPCLLASTARGERPAGVEVASGHQRHQADRESVKETTYPARFYSRYRFSRCPSASRLRLMVLQTPALPAELTSSWRAVYRSLLRLSLVEEPLKLEDDVILHVSEQLLSHNVERR